MKERRYRCLTAIPQVEYFREEGIVIPDDIFGSTEILLQSVIPELHVTASSHGISLTLDNPIRYGPVAVAFQGFDDYLVPGETLVVDEPSFTIFLRRREVLQMILLDRIEESEVSERYLFRLPPWS